MGVSSCFTPWLVGGNKVEAGRDTVKLKAEMAQNGRVMQNCVYASNPYHECTEACVHKSKDPNYKPHKNRKGFDYRRSVTDGELGKKMNEEKRSQSGCPKASNPYHVCDENCNKRRVAGADSVANSLSFGRKKHGSKPELPVLDSVPPSKIGAIYLSDASSPLSSYSDSGRKKMETKNSEIVPASGEIHVADIMPVNHKVQPKDDAEEFADPRQTKKEVDKNGSNKVVPVTSVDDTGGLTASAAAMDFAFSATHNGNEDSDGDDTESVVSESRVPVGKYHVKESFAPILLSIFEKYGDIGETCHLESVVMRSYYIECVCFLVQELQSASIMQLTKSKVKELMAILKDVESAQLRVAWLRSILNEIADNIEHINEHRAVEAEKAKSNHEVELLRKELESEMATLAQKEQEVTDLKTRVEEMRGRLSELELKSSDLDKNMSSIKSKVDNLDIKSLLDQLL
ncbi:hypothetical protein HN51_056611 [Arachis hypogaea]|uniref:Uncharacterized protein n=2 Tax=Arachis TaxID=3817 RepID=A0A444XUP9_ARAHY|nr:uncharacterized protein LOC107618464 isoform X1 [Arachis ipaensis]XP_025675157.1 uncharacterized protein LOC112775619 isoform X1 [Arachis hypogaea]RYQ93452.1 hypothetical protein Ahy_B09g099723 isoform B [Arachis hypogaea]